MQMLLIENALDSFHWSLKHLRDFLKLDNKYENPQKSTTYLKQAVIALNCALELFFKERISAYNPLLIYKTDSIPQVFIDYYKLPNDIKNETPLYDYVVTNDTTIHTIDYSKCIDLFCKLYDIPDGNKSDFENLNCMRNDIMHLGINNQQEYYLLAGRLSNILWFVQYKILYNLNYKTQIIRKIDNDILDIQFTLSSLNDSIWKNLKYHKIELICNKLEKVFREKEITDYSISKGLTIDCGITLDMEYASLLISMIYNNKREEIVALYSDPANNALILADSENCNGHVFGVIVINDTTDIPQKFYISRDDEGVLIPDYCEQGCFWQSKKHSKMFEYLSFSKDPIIKMFNLDYSSSYL